MMLPTHHVLLPPGTSTLSTWNKTNAKLRNVHREAQTLAIIILIMLDDGASAALPGPDFKQTESLCLITKDTGNLSVLQFLSRDGTTGRVDGLQFGHALNLG